MADAIHIATYYIGNILIEANERLPSHNNSSYRPSSRRAQQQPQPQQPYTGSSYVPGYTYPPPQQGTTGPLQTQQIYIPNDLVGCIIGKGGAKINEIRHLSASNIKIMEPGATGTSVNGGPAPQGGENERLVVITGQPHNISMAVQLLYQVRGSSDPSCTFRYSSEPLAVGSRETKAVTRCQQLGFVSKLQALHLCPARTGYSLVVFSSYVPVVICSMLSL